MDRVPLHTVVREWGRLGALGFGGPPAHVGLLRDLVVERRRWLDAREFEDAYAACNLLPGPASTQLAIYCAQRVAGRRGGLAGGLAFILPGLLMILVIGAALQDRPPAWLEGIGAGAAAAVVAVVAAAGLTLVRTGLRSARSPVYVAAGALAAAFAGASVVLVLLACGALELAWRARRHVAVHAWPVQLALAWTAFKVGALSYGGGYVIIPLLQGDAVDVHHWMSAAEFGSAVAYGQLTPGPVTHTVALVGWAAAGAPGALLAAAIAFAPSFVLVGLGAARFGRLRGNARVRAFLDGAGPAAAGAILGAVVSLAQALHEPWQAVVLAAAALALLARRPPLAVLAGGAVAGLAATTLS